MSVTITGIEELDKQLLALGAKGAKKVSTASTKKGITVVKKGIRLAASVHNKTGRMVASINGRFKRRRADGQVDAKVGIDVGVSRAEQAHHGHLVALGTKARWTGWKTIRRKDGSYRIKTGGRIQFTGKMPSDDFVGRGFSASEATAEKRIIDSLAEGILKETGKTS